MNKKIALALDFDGLIADGANECILVSWNGYFKKSIDKFSDEGLSEIPVEFKERFLNHRSFAKHLGHFFMPFNDFEHFISQEEFDKAYDAIDTDIIEAFVTAVTDYRQLARETHRQRWLNYHAFYDGIENLLKKCPHPIYVVTAKDAQSVQELLKNANITLPDSHIFGERRKKNEALSDICNSLDISRDSLHFYDDNILNARDAYLAGFKSFWAVWGYNAPEHFELATATKLPFAELNFTTQYLVDSAERKNDEIFA